MGEERLEPFLQVRPHAADVLDQILLLDDAQDLDPDPCRQRIRAIGVAPAEVAVFLPQQIHDLVPQDHRRQRGVAPDTPLAVAMISGITFQ